MLTKEAIISHIGRKIGQNTHGITRPETIAHMMSANDLDVAIVDYGKVKANDFADELKLKVKRPEVHEAILEHRSKLGPLFLPKSVSTAAYDKDVILMGGVKNRDMLMHELGHAKDFKEPKWYHSEKIRRLPIVSSINNLALEGAAQKNALSEIYKEQGLKDSVKSLSTAVPSYASYLAAAAGAAYLTGKGGKYLYRALKKGR